mgnify:CR=1 FL=1
MPIVRSLDDWMIRTQNIILGRMSHFVLLFCATSLLVVDITTSTVVLEFFVLLEFVFFQHSMGTTTLAS